MHSVPKTLSSKVDAKLQQQEERIKALEDRLEIQESSMAVLDKREARLNKKCEQIEGLKNRMDNGEQYSRRVCCKT